ncbi:MAG TPA: hypothetical protein VEA61_08630 [Allosphingosinicella sp.]|nr:hypothetical protein [Allosphingosinicella sp.]
MWVYHTQSQTVPRLKLPRGQGFWFDYWLALHADEAFGPWKVRPLGLVSLAQIARHRRTARNVAEELDGYRRLAAVADCEAPEDPVSIGDGVSAKWQSWLQRFADPDHHRGFIRLLTGLLEQRIRESRLGDIAYLSRRLASELAEHTRSSKDVFLPTRVMLEAERFDLRELVEGVMGETVQQDYVVEFQLSPVEVAADANAAAGASVKLVRQPNPGFTGTGKELAYVLTGLTVECSATSPSAAVRDAMPRCRAGLDHLRARHYLRTSLIGRIEVRCPITDEVKYFGLNEPFWNPRHVRKRPVPALPVHFPFLGRSVSAQEAERWMAMKWHVSQSLRAWPEDVHSAASNAWQAVESLLPKRPKPGEMMKAVYTHILSDYDRLVRRDYLEYLLRQYNYQRKVMGGGRGCDWVFCPSPAAPQIWLADVLRRSSPGWYGRWTKPRAFDYLFGREEGALSGLARPDGSFRSPGWTSLRLERDFGQLYTVRNAIVHRGDRLGSDRWVSYLASQALEALSTLARERILALSPHFPGGPQPEAVPATEPETAGAG